MVTSAVLCTLVIPYILSQAMMSCIATRANLMTYTLYNVIVTWCRRKVRYHDLLNYYCPVVEVDTNEHHGNEKTTPLLQYLVGQQLSDDQVAYFLD